ncbi:hypothetical protein [Runella sp.]|uniref:hypothetical protein n=1 Tax=Runella sp. TaxID=1960881 RepID=UPI003018F0A3
MENRDDEFYGPKDLLSPATREELLYIKSDLPTQTGFIEDSPAVAIGLQHDRNHIIDWLKATLPPLILILGIVSLTFTVDWNRGPKYSKISISDNSIVGSLKHKSTDSPNFEVQSKIKTYSSDLNKDSNRSEYPGVYKKPRLSSIEIKYKNNFIKIDSLCICNKELMKDLLVYQNKLRKLQREYQQVTMDLEKKMYVYEKHNKMTDEYKAHSYSIVDSDRKITRMKKITRDLNSCVYEEQIHMDDQSDLSFYDKNGMHLNLIVKLENKPTKLQDSLNTSCQKDLSSISYLKDSLLITKREIEQEVLAFEKAKYRAENNYLEARRYLDVAKCQSAELRSEYNKLAYHILSDLSDTVRILDACISGYQKTNVEIKHRIIIHLSTHGTITNDNCGISSGPEGIKHLLQITSPDCTPLDPNYNLGALLFRIGESDAWKPYTGDNMPIKIDKPGVLEFTINLKSTENIKGNYHVLAYEKPHEEEGK